MHVEFILTTMGWGYAAYHACMCASDLQLSKHIMYVASSAYTLRDVAVRSKDTMRSLCRRQAATLAHCRAASLIGIQHGKAAFHSLKGPAGKSYNWRHFGTFTPWTFRVSTEARTLHTPHSVVCACMTDEM